jgi:aldose 1-epimerase
MNVLVTSQRWRGEDIHYMTGHLQLFSPSVSASFSTFGARLTSLVVDGVDVIMGGATDLDFAIGDWTTGAVCGRVAGRIAHSSFKIDEQDVRVLPTFGPHQLHGGPDNFAVRHWNVESIDHGIRFTLVSPDGDQGYPGELTVTATYVLKGQVLSLDLQARTTKPTMVNLTNHAYWNLIGAQSAFEHEVHIEASRLVAMDDDLLVTGEIIPVEGTRFDFRSPRAVGSNYDNCWALDGKRGVLKKALTVRDPSSGRRMEVWTTESALQFYTAFHWNGLFPGKRGHLNQFEAIAIEPQNFGGAPNHAHFPSAVLRPGEVYRNSIEWWFG